jgi:hypothetical protein
MNQDKDKDRMQSRPTDTLSATPSQTGTANTAVDLTPHPNGKEKGEGGIIDREGRVAEVKLSQGRKWFLLFIFSIAQVSYPFVIGWTRHEC